MSLALGIVLAIALFTVGLLLAVVMALASRLKVLNASLQSFQTDVVPALDDVNKEAARTQERVDRVSRKASSLKPGVKIRR